MTLSEAIKEALKLVPTDLWYPHQHIRLQRPGWGMFYVVCPATQGTSGVRRVQINFLGSDLEEIVRQDVWTPTNEDLFAENWNFFIARKRVDYDHRLDRLFLEQPLRYSANDTKTVGSRHLIDYSFAELEEAIKEKLRRGHLPEPVELDSKVLTDLQMAGRAYIEAKRDPAKRDIAVDRFWMMGEQALELCFGPEWRRHIPE